jgi:hypothetical protein
MPHHFRFVINIDVTRETGKFAGRDELETAIQDALDNADPGTISCDEGGEYNIDAWEVSVEPLPSKRSRKIKKGEGQ